MRILKSNYNTLVGVFLLVLSVLSIELVGTGLVYRPNNYYVFLIVFFIVSVVLATFSVCFRKYANKISRLFGFMLPFLAFIYAFILIGAFDFTRDNKMEDTFYFCLLFVILMTSSIVVFFVHFNNFWIQICISIVLIVFEVFLAYIMFISFLLSNFGENTIVQTVYSPDNIYSAYVLSSDQGGLGGSTHVYVRRIDKDIKLLTGTFITNADELWIGNWGEEPTVFWIDENNVSVNGKEYKLETNFHELET
ncbi:MAG: hypothetical protein IJN48_03290 [Clostridia bacterium]|nr:hypothetical protein [Clostridia bacterium]